MIVRRADTFDLHADNYARYRPDWPAELVDWCLEVGKLSDRATLLEVGCGTGQATVRLVERGHDVTAVELGRTLATLAQQRLPDVAVTTGDFLTCPLQGTFDAIVSFQAFHWLDTAPAIDRCVSLLDPGGIVLLAWNRDVSQGTDLWRATSPIYERFLPSTSGPTPRTAAEAHAGRLREDPRFLEVSVHRRTWERTFDKEQWLGVLQTFSDHIALGGRLRQMLAAIADAIDETGGTVLRRYSCELVTARRA